MDRSEPTLVPEWLKGSGSLGGGGSGTHQMMTSSPCTDDNVASKPSRSKPLVTITDHDIGRPFFSDRTTSSYFRRSSSSNGSVYGRPYGSFNRNNRDREWEKETYDSRDRERSVLGDHRHRDYPDPFDNILPSRFEKDLRRSQSMIPGKRIETRSRKVQSDSVRASKSSVNSSNGLVSGGSGVSSMHKAAFERDFPSLGADERQAAPEIGRVSSPGLNTAIQSLPTGSSAIGGDGWTSALVEVPVLVGTNGTSGSVQRTIPPTSVSLASSTLSGLNMAETVAQGPSRAHNTPQLSSGTQRLEELAIKQSRQLIPMTPAMPKALTINPSDKSKPKVGQPQQQQVPPQISPRSGPAKSDFSRTSSGGKLHVLKPAREKNGLSPTAKDSSSPTNASRVASNSVAVAPSAVGSAPLKSPSNSPNVANAMRKPALNVLEKRPTPQSQSRNDFFNLMRKKSMTSVSSALSSPALDVPSSASDKAVESIEAEIGSVSVAHRDSDPSSAGLVEDQSTEKSSNTSCNGIPSNIPQKAFNDKDQEPLNNGKDCSSTNAILYSEEEEAAFLRSLGWDENNAGEDEGLTEEEISSFYELMKLRSSSRTSRGIQPKFLVHPNLCAGNGGTGALSGASSSDSKMES